jgi:hypothetical protein
MFTSIWKISYRLKLLRISHQTFNPFLSEADLTLSIFAIIAFFITSHTVSVLISFQFLDEKRYI